MDCPNCGVYNPEERTVCWRCDQELPKPKAPKKKADPALAQRRMWLIIGIVLVLWLLLTWLLPMLLGGGGAPAPKLCRFPFLPWWSGICAGHTLRLLLVPAFEALCPKSVRIQGCRVSVDDPLR